MGVGWAAARVNRGVLVLDRKVLCLVFALPKDGSGQSVTFGEEKFPKISEKVWGGRSLRSKHGSGRFPPPPGRR